MKNINEIPAVLAPALREIFDAPIHTCTRAQAIDDGVLIDVTETAREAGFRLPVALTRAVFADCVAWGELDTRRRKAPQDEAGRLLDVLWMAHGACCRQHDSSVARFYLSRVPRVGRGRYVELIANIGPGDEGEPVVTIMQSDED